MTTRGLVTVSVGGTSFSVRPRYGGFKVIGRGSYGVVVSATDSETKKKVAIKRIKPMAGHASDAKHALREIRCMKLLGVHANILGVKDLFCDTKENALYIAMELLDSDLHRIIQSPQELSDAHHRFFMYQLVRGCKYMHEQGIIHRDLKPGNLLVTRACELRITDFGLARLQSVCSRGEGGDVDAGPMTQHVVTRWYRPPELMLAPDGRYTNSVDMWSVGCILAELLGRRPLFPGKNFVHQLQLIFDVIGAPLNASKVRNKQARKFLETVKGKVKVPFAKVFPKAHRAAHDVLEKLLAYSALDRVSATELLSHDYFRTLSYADALPITEPQAEGADFRFEYEEVSTDALKGAIVEEVRAFDPPSGARTKPAHRGASDEAKRALERSKRADKAEPPRRDTRSKPRGDAARDARRRDAARDARRESARDAARREAVEEARREVEASAQRARDREAREREEARRAEKDAARERERRARERESQEREAANAREAAAREASSAREAAMARERYAKAREDVAPPPRRRRDDPISRAFREAAAEPRPRRRDDPLSQRFRENAQTESRRYAEEPSPAPPPRQAPAYVYEAPKPPPTPPRDLPRRPPAPLPAERERARPAPPQRAPPAPPSPRAPARTFANQISRDAGRAPDLPPRVASAGISRHRRSDDSGGGPSYLRDTARSKAYTKASRAYAPLRRGTRANAARNKHQPTVPKSPAFSKFSWQKPRARESAY